MGPKVSKLNPASQPSLTQPGLGLLNGIFGQGGQGTPLQQMGTGSGPGQMANRASPMGAQASGMGGGIFGNIANAFGAPNAMQTLGQLAAGPNPGQGIVNAYQPIFQRNLSTAMDTGPRFSSGNDQLRTQAMNDYNMFAQNALLGGQQQQLQAALGAGGMQNQIAQQLLSTLFTGGGINAGPIYNVQPGLGQQLLGLAGTAAGAYFGGPAGAAAGSQLGGGGASVFGTPQAPQWPTFGQGVNFGQPSAPAQSPFTFRP